MTPEIQNKSITMDSYKTKTIKQNLELTGINTARFVHIKVQHVWTHLITKNMELVSFK
jgi:hypothetical protein